MFILRRFMLCCTVVLIALSMSRAQAAQPSDPLQVVLSRIPDSALSRNEIYYENTLAIESAYPPAKTPTTLAQFQALGPDSKNDPTLAPIGLWWLVFKNMQSPFGSAIGAIGDMPAVMGFNFFDIQQDVLYGIPPATATQLYGKFDPDQVRKAFGTQGFTRSDRGDVELWCGSAGCESGTKLNMSGINRANLFGGDLGRQEPLIIGDGYLIGSPSYDFIQQHIGAITKQAKSLADAPEYQAAANAITANGTLLQAVFVDGQTLNDLGDFTWVTQAFTRQGNKNVLKRVLQEQLKNYQTLPPYQLLVFADTATDSEQIGLVALVYDHADDAKTASTIIPARLTSGFSAVNNRPFKDILAARNVSDVKAQIIDDASTGKTVLLLSLATPKATPDQIYALAADPLNAPKVTSPGLIYHFLVQNFESRDVTWLSTVPRETLEQQLQALGG